MTEDKRPLRYWLVGQHWSEGWFLLALLVGLFFGLPGLLAALTSYLGLRTVGNKLPRPFAAAAAFALGVLVFFAFQALLGPR